MNRDIMRFRNFWITLMLILENSNILENWDVNLDDTVIENRKPNFDINKSWCSNPNFLKIKL